MAAIGARVTEQLMRLIQRLSGFQSLLGAETIEAIGMALQFCQVVKAGRGHALRFRLHGFDARLAGLRPRNNLFGLITPRLALRRQAHALLQGLVLYGGAKPGGPITGGRAARRFHGERTSPPLRGIPQARRLALKARAPRSWRAWAFARVQRKALRQRPANRRATGSCPPASPHGCARERHRPARRNRERFLSRQSRTGLP